MDGLDELKVFLEGNPRQMDMDYWLIINDVKFRIFLNIAGLAIYEIFGFAKIVYHEGKLVTVIFDGEK